MKKLLLAAEVVAFTLIMYSCSTSMVKDFGEMRDDNRAAISDQYDPYK